MTCFVKDMCVESRSDAGTATGVPALVSIILPAVCCIKRINRTEIIPMPKLSGKQPAGRYHKNRKT